MLKYIALFLFVLISGANAQEQKFKNPLFYEKMELFSSMALITKITPTYVIDNGTKRFCEMKDNEENKVSLNCHDDDGTYNYTFTIQNKKDLPNYYTIKYEEQTNYKGSSWDKTKYLLVKDKAIKQEPFPKDKFINPIFNKKLISYANRDFTYMNVYPDKITSNFNSETGTQKCEILYQDIQQLRLKCEGYYDKNDIKYYKIAILNELFMEKPYINHLNYYDESFTKISSSGGSYPENWEEGDFLFP